MTLEALRQMLNEIGVLDEAGLQQSLEDIGIPKTTMTSRELLHWVLRRYALRVVRDSESALRSTLSSDIARTLGVAMDVSAARDDRAVYDLVASWATRTNDPRFPYHLVGIGTALATRAQRLRAVALGLPVRAASPLGCAHLADEVATAFQHLANLGFDLPAPPLSSWELPATDPGRMLAVAFDAVDIGVSLANPAGAMRPTQGHLPADTLRALHYALGRVLPIQDVRVKASWRATFQWRCGTEKRQLELEPDRVESLGALIDAIDADLDRLGSNVCIIVIAFPSVAVACDDRYRVLVLPPGHAHALVAAGMPILAGRRKPAPLVGRFAPLRYSALRPEDICASARIAKLAIPLDLDDDAFSEDEVLDQLVAITAGAVRVEERTESAVTFDIGGTRHRVKRPHLLDEEGDPDVDSYVRSLNRAFSGTKIREKFIAIKERSDVRVVTIGFGAANVARQLRDAGF